MKKNKIAFIINPNSGVGKHQLVEKYALEYLQKEHELQFLYTQYPKHAMELAESCKKNQFNIVAAVGGDGSVNEIASSLYQTDVKLAIIPCGSGNGLARNLKIPIDIKKSIQLLNDFKTKKIDTILFNEKPFWVAAGLGFDAYVCHLFNQTEGRGLKNYLKITLKEYPNYKNIKYTLYYNNETVSNEAFILSIANANQYGNNAFIAPNAELDDGKFSLIAFNKSSLLKNLTAAIKLFTKNLRNADNYSELILNQVKIVHNSKYAHVDGENFLINCEPVEIKILPKSLNVIIKDE